MTSSARDYWRRTRSLTLKLLLLWLVTTFGISWHASDLNAVSIGGFPLGFYMAAQGALVVYLGIIWFYNRKMKKLDTEYWGEE